MVKVTDEVKETKKLLKKILRKGHYKVYCKLNHVSRSGMRRVIDFYTIVDDKPIYLTGYISKITSYKRTLISHKYEGLIVDGCGMDMGFAVVYDLGRTLYPKGFKVKGIGRNGDTSGWDNNGGYKLKHIWI